MTDMTIREARDAWDATISDKGGDCPCCDRWGKVYRYKISEADAKALLWMCSHTDIDNTWIDMPRQAPRWVVATNSFTKLKWWGAIQRHPAVSSSEDGRDKKFTGMWRVTDLGLLFGERLTQLPKYAYVYNDRLKSLSDETCFISDCFKEHFDYEEIMQATWGKS